MSSFSTVNRRPDWEMPSGGNLSNSFLSSRMSNPRENLAIPSSSPEPSFSSKEMQQEIQKMLTRGLKEDGAQVKYECYRSYAIQFYHSDSNEDRL